VAKVDKFIFETAILSTLFSSSLGQARSDGAGISDFSTTGWICGGSFISGFTNAVEKIDFATGVVSNVGTILNNYRAGMGSASSKYNRGYICGGYNSSLINIIETITLDKGICTNLTTASLDVGVYSNGGLTEWEKYAFFAGGMKTYFGNSNSVSGKMQQVSVAAPEAFSALSAEMNIPRWGMACISNPFPRTLNC
jgi:hypothetical protein